MGEEEFVRYIPSPGGPIEGPWSITRPGMYDGMPDAWYHRDPVRAGSVSHSGLKEVLECPAKYAAALRYGRPPRDHYDDGHILHGLVLGNGSPIAVVNADTWQTNAAKAARADARERGAVPVLADKLGPIREQVAALRAKPQIGDMFTPGTGVAERVHVWYDDRFGVWCRSKVDWTYRDADGRLIMVDYKSTVDASPDAISRWMWRYGYYTQHAFYHRGAVALGETDPRFLFVFQEKERPYVTTVAELAPEDVAWGAVQVNHALDVYTHCRTTGTWPEYSEGVVTIRLPRYADRELTRMWESGMLEVID